MVEKVRKTEEEEIIEILLKEGFEELSETEVSKEPYKSIHTLPDCFINKSESSNDKTAK